MLTSLMVPPTVAKPKGQVASSTSCHSAPPRTCAIRAPSSTVTLLQYLERSMTIPPLVDEAPEGLCPPPVNQRDLAAGRIGTLGLTFDRNLHLLVDRELDSGRDILLVLDESDDTGLSFGQDGPSSQTGFVFGIAGKDEIAFER
jgi:hypothetical protein